MISTKDKKLFLTNKISSIIPDDMANPTQDRPHGSKGFSYFQGRVAPGGRGHPQG